MFEHIEVFSGKYGIIINEIKILEVHTNDQSNYLERIQTRKDQRDL
mgnify:CR=1 FL=1